LRDRLLFGSVFNPFRPIGQSIEDFCAAGFEPSVIDRPRFDNAVESL